MNGMNEHDDDLGRRLRRAQLVTTTAKLKQRALDAARAALQDDGADQRMLAWAAPLLRLAAAVVLVTALVMASHWASERALRPWSPSRQAFAVDETRLSTSCGALSGNPILSRLAARAAPSVRPGVWLEWRRALDAAVAQNHW